MYYAFDSVKILKYVFFRRLNRPLSYEDLLWIYWRENTMEKMLVFQMSAYHNERVIMIECQKSRFILGATVEHLWSKDAANFSSNRSEKLGRCCQ